MKQGFHPMADNTKKPIDLSSIENFEIEPAWVKHKVIQVPMITPAKNRNDHKRRKRDGRSKGFKGKKRAIRKIAIKKD